MIGWEALAREALRDYTHHFDCKHEPRDVDACCTCLAKKLLEEPDSDRARLEAEVDLLTTGMLELTREIDAMAFGRRQHREVA